MTITTKRWKLLTIIKKRSILDVAAVLDPPLVPILLKPMEKHHWGIFNTKEKIDIKNLTFCHTEELLNKFLNFADNYTSIHQENTRIINIADISCYSAIISHGKKSTTTPSNLAELCGIIFTYIINLHWKKVSKNDQRNYIFLWTFQYLCNYGLSNTFATQKATFGKNVKNCHRRQIIVKLNRYWFLDVIKLEN